MTAEMMRRITENPLPYRERSGRVGEGRGGKIKSMDKKITFGADRVMVRGPRASDGALTVVIETGEYQREQVAEVVRIPPNTPVKVTLEYEE